MKKTILVLATMAAVSLSACSESLDGMGNKQMIGAGTGALLGGVLGSKVGKGDGQLWATGAGALLGLAVGNSIGQSLDRADIAYANRAEEQAYTAPVGRTIKWNNPETGRYGSVTPVRDGRASDGRYCREFKTSIFIDGEAQTANGRACQNNDGSWQVVN